MVFEECHLNRQHPIYRPVMHSA
ncbi:hypothetical protein SSYM_1084, partial [Serratia symbiotica str. Tucson]